jgi:putative phosphoribosyl transferase
MIFQDRHDAGKQLVHLLAKYKNRPQAIVLGLPRGGVVTAYEVAKGLQLPLDVTCPRKIGAPFNQELAIGAITETGEGVFNEDLITRLEIPEIYISHAIEIEKKQAQRRVNLYRKNRPNLSLEGKTVILVDDGLATGATMKAAIKSVKVAGADKIVVAVPISPPDTFQEIKEEVDEAFCLDTPIFFQAVGQFYEDFSQTEDEEVIELLSQTTKKQEKIKQPESRSK